MADSFFGFDTTLGDSGLEDGLDCPLEEDDLGEEEEYDALNDETFGPDATIGDWEKDHEKLAKITESSRPHNQNATNKKNGVNVDIQDNLSHLVLDDKEGIVPRPGVWSSPSDLSLPKVRPRLSLPTNLKNACTVEELERGLIANRPPPGLSKPQTQQQQKKSEGSLLFEALSLNEKLQINGLPPPLRFPPGLGIPGTHPMVLPNVRPPSQFMPPPRLLLNQSGNMLRYPVPHLMLPHTVQRQTLHGSYGFSQPPHPNLGSPQFLRPDHMMPPFSNNQTNHQQHQHSYSHSSNQRNQNRPYHHNEQQSGHQPFFKNNQYLHRNHDRNNQRHYHNQYYSPSINGMNASGEYDEYAGLMSSREKQWLINIQLLQLNTIQPYIDDYYYTVFCDRQNKQHANQEQKDRKHYNNNGYHRDHRDWETNPPQTLSRSAYTPATFENSLGKLHFSSVTAPRKIIDMDVVPNSDSQSTPQSQQKDTKRTRQLLLEIERLYIILLKLEDLNNPLAVSSEPHQQQEGEAETSANKTEPELISMMLSSLQQLVQDDKLASMLSIRKGKTLLLRFLPHLDVTEYQEQLKDLWTAIFKGLAIIGRRDCHLLTNFYSEYRRWLNTVKSFDTILQLAGALSNSVVQPIKNNSLAFALMNKFGVSAIAALFEQSERLCAAEVSLPSEWSAFVITITDMVGNSPSCVTPCQPVAANTLNKHLNRIPNLQIERSGHNFVMTV
ncbi:protein PAT1 homolog 1 isoform X2 [Harpegnathos saltator]|uniref:protein PAT1 homolog 1 isoform X2 n=1 Tax=Harpegnathos saltator TaxID=610380 RepID=UPI00058C7E42|nr:protein PAT1 homolog 1 isoform X2 [Harpegnathos saltator]